MRAFSLFVILVLVAATFPGLVVAQDRAGAPGQPLEVQDKKGDVSVFSAPTPGSTSTPVTDPTDLVSLRVFNEDIQGFEVELGVSNLKGPPQAVSFVSSSSYSVAFTLEGTQVHYRLFWSVFRNVEATPDPQENGIKPIGAGFCLYLETTACYSQRAVGTVDWDKSLLHAYIPKGALVGHEAVSDRGKPPRDPEVGVGSRLANFVATSQGNFGVTDRMPDQGTAGPFVLTSAVANGRIQVSLPPKADDKDSNANSYGDYAFAFIPADSYPSMSVAPGGPSLVQVQIKNDNGAKRILNVSAKTDDPKDAADWNLRILGSVAVPGNGSRIVNLVVTAGPGVQHRDSALIDVVARSLGYADEVGAMKLRVVAAVQPSPTHRDLFLHVNDYGSGSVCIGCTGYGWLNVLEKDPSADRDSLGAKMAYNTGLTTTTFTFAAAMDSALSSDLVLDAAQPGSAVIVIKSPLPLSGTLAVNLQTADGALASGNAEYNAGGTTVPLAILKDQDRVAAGSSITMRVALTTQTPFLQQGLDNASVLIFGTGSKVTLPVIPDPHPAKVTKIPDGPAFISLSVDNGTERFVNPGKVRVFPITVVNEGVQSDTVRISYTKDPANWYVGFNPGTAFHLKPGESAKLGVLVKPPTGAKEGEKQTIVLNATSEADPTALSQLTLHATVTQNVEIQDESDNFTADEDTGKALEAPAKHKSPGIEADLVAVVALAVVLLRRRRDD